MCGPVCRNATMRCSLFFFCGTSMSTPFPSMSILLSRLGLNAPLTGCSGRHKDRAQGEGRPWALCSGERQTFDTIKPCARGWTQFHLAIHLWLTLSHGSSALYQSHFSTSHFWQHHKCARCLCGPLHFEGLFIFWAEGPAHVERPCTHWSFHLTASMLFCLKRNEKNLSGCEMLQSAERHEDIPLRWR